MLHGSQPWVRTLFNGRRIMFNADLQKWTRVKPKKNQTLAPNMMEKEMAEEEKEMAEEEEKKFQEEEKKFQKLQEEIKEEETKFQELAKKLEQEITEARASLYATGTGSSTTATGTTGQAAATKLHKA